MVYVGKTVLESSRGMSGGGRNSGGIPWWWRCIELQPVPQHRLASSMVATIPRITDLKSWLPQPTGIRPGLHKKAGDSGCIGFARNVDYCKFFTRVEFKAYAASNTFPAPKLPHLSRAI